MRHHEILNLKLLIAGVLLASPVLATNLVSQTMLVTMVQIEHEVLSDGDIRGVIKNTSESYIKNVQLLVKYSYIWASAEQQGNDNPSWAEYITITSELEPGQAVPFSYDLKRPLQNRRDGKFSPSVEIISVTPYQQRPEKG